MEKQNKASHMADASNGNVERQLEIKELKLRQKLNRLLGKKSAKKVLLFVQKHEDNIYLIKRQIEFQKPIIGMNEISYYCRYGDNRYSYTLKEVYVYVLEKLFDEFEFKVGVI